MWLSWGCEYTPGLPHYLKMGYFSDAFHKLKAKKRSNYHPMKGKILFRFLLVSKTGAHVVFHKKEVA